jgi:hypothetical protein
MMRPAYREPWHDGAYAYPQADTLAALVDGTRRKRRPLTVHVAHAACEGLTCAGCGYPLDAPYPVNPGDETDEWRTDDGGYAYVDVNPARGTFTARHYYCAWGSTMRDVVALSRAIGG